MSDLISRQAAIYALDGKITVTGATNAEAVRDYVNAVKDRIERIPSIQPKRGEWLERGVTYIDELEAKDIITEWQSAKCSVCGKYHTTPYMYYFDEYKYCPNCGADMRGGNE